MHTRSIIMRLFAAASIAVLTSCSMAAQPAKQPGPSDTVATVGTTNITLAQVDERALRLPASSFGNARLSQALYLARRAALEELIGDELMQQEARARRVDRSSLFEKEISNTVATPTEADVAAWFQANQARVQGATLDQVRAPIRALLIEERMNSAKERFLSMLREKTAVHITLEPPRLAITDTGHPSKGPAEAPVVIVEFSDFQCAFCQRARPTVRQVLAEYGDRVRYVYRHYPLPNHPNARPAAEASACANEQGRFWPYHDQLFANPSKLAENDLRAYAAAVGLDAEKFDACFTGRRFKNQVDADMKEADEAGVSGTPAFFINGRSLEGAQPFEAFKRIIDEELAKKSSKP